ncbi:MAG: hypothetical protein VB858_19405 [Planctomycetaceae bacterium]
MAPESRCAVFLNSEQVREAGGFRDVDSPVRELIIRLSQRDTRTVTLLERDISGCSSDTANALPPCDADLPATAPVWPPSSHHWLAAVIKSLHVRQALPHISSDIEASAFHAGVWQINDWLDESHSCSQAIEGAGEGNGDYWHAIMHRREPDAGNARYWFRRVGDHACCGPLADIASQALEECHSPAAELWMNRLGRTEMWDSAAFVDFCQTAQEGSDPDLMQAARRIQWAEMLILLAHTAQQ